MSCTQRFVMSCRRAREKREVLRSAHLAPDYIPLGGAAALTRGQNITSTPLGASGPQPVTAVAAGSHTSGDSDSASEGEAPDSRMTFVGGDPSAASRRKGAPPSRQALGGYPADALSSLPVVRCHTPRHTPLASSTSSFFPPPVFTDGVPLLTYCHVADCQRCAMSI